MTIREDRKLSIKRLKDMITVLEDVQKAHKPFDLSIFMGIADQNGDTYDDYELKRLTGGKYHEAHKLEGKDIIDIVTQHSCGTTACACGWAAIHPLFRDTPLGENIETVKGKDGREYTVSRFGWFEVDRTFPEIDTTIIFTSSGYPLLEEIGPDDVIRKIKEEIALQKRLIEQENSNP